MVESLIMFGQILNSFFGNNLENYYPIILMTYNCIPSIVYQINNNGSVEIDTYINYSPSILPSHIFDLPEACGKAKADKLFINKKKKSIF